MERRVKEFDFLTHKCFVTDDSVMSLAVAKALLLCDGNNNKLSGVAVSCMQELGRKYPHAGYGGNFSEWIFASNRNLKNIKNLFCKSAKNRTSNSRGIISP